MDLINVDLIDLIHHNTCIATFVWLSPGLPCLKSNELIYMVQILKVRTHFSCEFDIVIRLSL
jgi:hypothetical protein